MSGKADHHVFLANGATGKGAPDTAWRLHYLAGQPGLQIRIGLPRFVQDVYHLPSRILDLLEIACYVFAADRCVIRGRKDAVEYQAWSRPMAFCIRVRDYDFWSDRNVRDLLSETLEFMTGDAEYTFEFEPGHSTPPTGLFDSAEFSVHPGSAGIAVTLFSGGLDSLSGTLDLLTTTDRKVVLVSHQSQPGTVHTQRALVKALKSNYRDRLVHYTFECTLRDFRAREETQRTRSFLYTSIAYAIASAYGELTFSVYENGVTSINLPRREDLVNARASRTTHPKTITKMVSLFSLIQENEVTIKLPYLYNTKTDIFRRLLSSSKDLISSAVSCSRTFQVSGQATHCGQCFQCVDRRISAYAAKAETYDHRGLYTHDIIGDPISDREAKTVAVDYIRQAISFADGSIDTFQDQYFTEVADLLPYLPDRGSDAERVTHVWNLLKRHGYEVRRAIERMRGLHENVFRPLPPDSILGIVSAREYLKPETIRLAESITRIIRTALPEMFSHERPKDESDLNKKLGALLRTHEESLRSEHPTTAFACACVVPDHLHAVAQLLIEAKYIRASTTPSKASEGIAADLTKYPIEAFILFVVYDPEHRIPNDDLFQLDIENKGRNRVLILR